MPYQIVRSKQLHEPNVDLINCVRKQILNLRNSNALTPNLSFDPVGLILRIITIILMGPNQRLKIKS